MLNLLALFLLQDEIIASEEEALEALFGKAAIVHGRITLAEDQKKILETKLRCRIDLTHPVIVAHDGKGGVAGFAMVWEEIGKYKPITFLVGTDPAGKILGVHILVYREPIGGDVSKAWWRRQFVGKSSKDPIKRDKDILKIGGATMSCDGVCLGVRKAVGIIDSALVPSPESVKKIIQADPKEKPARRQQLVMGTICSIEAYGEGAADAIAKAFAEIQRLDDILSNYKDESELTRLNKAGEIDASPELLDFVTQALNYAKQSKGMFDPTIEPAVRLWGFFDHKFKVPSDEDVAKVKALVGFERVKIDGKKITLKPGMAIDPGGLGKGYALDRAAKILRDAGIRSAFIDFGQSALYAIGSPPGEPGWRVALKNPADPTSTLLTIRVKDASVSTSAQYEKLFEDGDRQYGHILDPRTCRPVETMGSVTVVHANASMADALSTALFVTGGLENAKAWGIEAALVDKEGKVESTDGFGKLIVSEK